MKLTKKKRFGIALYIILYVFVVLTFFAINVLIELNDTGNYSRALISRDIKYALIIAIIPTFIPLLVTLAYKRIKEKKNPQI